MSYTAPVKDIAFVLNKVVGLDEIAKLDGFEEATPDLVDAILEESARFTGEVLAPLNTIGDKQGSSWSEDGVTTPDGWKEAYAQFVESGWGALAFPAEYGGQGLPMCVSSAVQEMWHSANMSFGLCPLLSQGAVDAIFHHASDELKDRFLPKMVEGVWSGTMNLTESHAGTDLASIRTSAEPSGDHYLIKGTKIFITYGEQDLTENIVHLVLARLPDAPPGVKGISLFIVPKFLVNDDGSIGERNDLKCVSLEHKLGIHASPTCVMSYGDNDGAVGYLVGKEHHGLMYMFTMMNQARHAVGVEGYGIAERAYQQAVSYAKDRTQGPTLLGSGEDDQGIINHPDVRRILMTMRSNIGELLTPLVKGWSTEVGVELCSLGVQVHGGMGFIEETGAAQHLRDARIAPIYEGTTAIQANDLIGRKAARDGGQGLSELFADMNATLSELEKSDDVNVKAMAKRFSVALRSSEEATQWLLGQNDATLPAATSVEFLMMQGRMAGGWMIARSALAAVKEKAIDGADLPFLDAKIMLARYYAERMLPLVESSSTVVMQSAESTIAVATDQL